MKAQLRLLPVIFVVSVIVFLVNRAACAEDDLNSALTDSSFHENWRSIANQPIILEDAHSFVEDSILPILDKHYDNILSIGLNADNALTTVTSMGIVNALTQARLLVMIYAISCDIATDCSSQDVINQLAFNLSCLNSLAQSIQRMLLVNPENYLFAIQGNEAKKDLEKIAQRLKLHIPASAEKAVMDTLERWERTSRE